MDRTGVFICGGCGISDEIDMDALARVALEEGGVASRVFPALCGNEALSAMRDDIAKESLDSILIAACSVRHKKDVFSSLEPHAVLRRVCLREQVAWNRNAEKEDIQAAAVDQMMMEMAALTMVRKPTAAPNGVTRSVLIVGAGLCGMVAADAVARLGYHAYLVEKEDQPGGYLRNVKTVAPWQAPFDVPAPSPASRWVDAVRRNSNITLLTRTEITAISGQPGQFCVDAGDRHLKVGAIIQTTGARPVPRKALSTAYDVECPDIITGADFEKLLAGVDAFRRPSNGAVPQKVVFIQCAGSREETGLPYCSRECCQMTLKQIHRVLQLMPEVECQVIFRDMRAGGLMELFYGATLSLENVTMIKGEVNRVETIDGTPSVSVANTIFGESVRIDADVVVAATGMVPCASDGEALRMLRDAERIILKNESQQQVAQARERMASLAHLDTPSILHLDYRQGPDLPQLQYRFPDSHFICFPYETRRTGIYAAGTVRAPMDIAMGIADAKGAAMMAVQCIEAAARGESMLPRIADRETADFFMQRCTLCKRCTEECPYGALNEDEKGTPLYNPTRCRRCGVCLGACPERIVSFDSHSVDTVAAMIKAPEIPDEFDEKPRILVFMCENDAAPALDAAAREGLRINPWVRFIEIRCLGSFHNVWVADALARGYDGVLLMGCRTGDDYQCHNIQGAELAHTRIANIGETLERLALDKERVRVVEVARDESAPACALIEQFSGEIEKLGPNPLKGL
jgi:quinone-modifying oxidoreductase, subunit QmoB